MIDPGTAFAISVAHGVNESVYSETVADLEAAHFPVSIEQRDPEHFAALQYLMPTALVVYLLKPYAEKFLGKLAEDNYDSCKAVLKRLWTNCIAEDRKFRMQLVGTQGKIPDAELGADLSFVVRTSDEQAFRLLFPNGISASDFQSAVLRFYSLIEEHDRNPEISVLNKRSSFRPQKHSLRILTWALDAGCLVEVDVIESAQRRMLVTIEIPHLDS